MTVLPIFISPQRESSSIAGQQPFSGTIGTGYHLGESQGY
jgi:hypothetical protein